MDYVIRALDSNGKLRKERFMFYSVRILDKNGILKRVVKEKILSKKHWESFSDKTANKTKSKSNFNQNIRSNTSSNLG